MVLANEDRAERVDRVGVDACDLPDAPNLAVRSLDGVVTDAVVPSWLDGVRELLLSTRFRKSQGFWRFQNT